MRDWFEDLSETIKFLIIGIIVLFIIGGVALAYTSYFGPKFKDQERQQFQNSQTHQDAVVQDLTARCAELSTTTDTTAKKAIEVVIAQRAAVEDLNALQMADSVRACVNKALNDYTGGK
jgi:flagellar basal body-associated protein FliL